MTATPEPPFGIVRAAIKAFLGRAGTTLDAFLPDLENHELMFSLGKHFEDGPLIPALVADQERHSGVAFRQGARRLR